MSEFFSGYLQLPKMLCMENDMILNKRGNEIITVIEAFLITNADILPHISSRFL